MQLVHNIGELVTMSPLAGEGRFHHIQSDDLGCLRKSWLLIDQGKVKDFGTGKQPELTGDAQMIDAEGGLVLPGLVDNHTHPLFGGDRSNEFAMRLDGASYQQIAAQGGGILSTIAATREASDEELASTATARLKKFLSYGVTTVECKTGYGQTAKEELRHLRILKTVSKDSPQHTELTYLGLHATPKDVVHKGMHIDAMTEVLEEIKGQDLANWVDAFVENGYFSVGETQRYFQKAIELGFKIRIHADEFADSGAALAASRWKAASADHLEECSAEGLQAMIDQGVVTTLLPGTSLYSKIKYADGKLFAQKGAAVALASDFNPGSCLFHNLPFVASLGALNCNLTPSITLAAVTWVAAKSLDLHHKKGALAKGYDADFLIHPSPNKEGWLADFGQTKPRSVFIAGEKIN